MNPPWSIPYEGIGPSAPENFAKESVVQLRLPTFNEAQEVTGYEYPVATVIGHGIGCLTVEMAGGITRQVVTGDVHRQLKG